MENYVETISGIIKEIKPSAEFTEDTKLLDEHVLDSLLIVSLVSELSDEFDVDITPVDVVPENFATVNSIADMIERKEEED